MGEWRKSVRERLMATSLRSAKIGANIRVSPRDVYAAYDRDRDRFVRPERVRLRMLAVSYDAGDAKAAREEVEQARARFLAGTDFAEVVKRSPHADPAHPAGDWGWVEPDSLRAELAAELKRTPVRGVTDIIETGDTIYIAMIEDRQPAGTAPFEEVAQDVERQLREDESNRLVHEWMNDLRRLSHVVVMDTNVF
jgi:parvulin-like peptidyl-prolyl isomerase